MEIKVVYIFDICNACINENICIILFFFHKNFVQAVKSLQLHIWKLVFHGWKSNNTKPMVNLSIITITNRFQSGKTGFQRQPERVRVLGPTHDRVLEQPEAGVQQRQPARGDARLLTQLGPVWRVSGGDRRPEPVSGRAGRDPEAAHPHRAAGRVAAPPGPPARLAHLRRAHPEVWFHSSNCVLGVFCDGNCTFSALYFQVWLYFIYYWSIHRCGGCFHSQAVWKK